MCEEESEKILGLLRSGELREIGGRVGRGSAVVSEPPTAGGRAPFAAVYLIWGATYLAIRYAVETIPPLLMMGMRHLTGGLLLFGWARWRGVPAPRVQDWFYPALVRDVLFLGGHGSLAWA